MDGVSVVYARCARRGVTVAWGLLRGGGVEGHGEACAPLHKRHPCLPTVAETCPCGIGMHMAQQMLGALGVLRVSRDALPPLLVPTLSLRVFSAAAATTRIPSPPIHSRQDTAPHALVALCSDLTTTLSHRVFPPLWDTYVVAGAAHQQQPVPSPQCLGSVQPLLALVSAAWPRR